MQDLHGRNIAAPAGSTAHLQLPFLLEVYLSKRWDPQSLLHAEAIVDAKAAALERLSKGPTVCKRSPVERKNVNMAIGQVYVLRKHELPSTVASLLTCDTDWHSNDAAKVMPVEVAKAPVQNVIKMMEGSAIALLGAPTTKVYDLRKHELPSTVVSLLTCDADWHSNSVRKLCKYVECAHACKYARMFAMQNT